MPLVINVLGADTHKHIYQHVNKSNFKSPGIYAPAGSWCLPGLKTFKGSRNTRKQVVTIHD